MLGFDKWKQEKGVGVTTPDSVQDISKMMEN